MASSRWRTKRRRWPAPTSPKATRVAAQRVRPSPCWRSRASSGTRDRLCSPAEAGVQGPAALSRPGLLAFAGAPRQSKPPAPRAPCSLPATLPRRFPPASDSARRTISSVMVSLGEVGRGHGGIEHRGVDRAALRVQAGDLGFELFRALAQLLSLARASARARLSALRSFFEPPSPLPPRPRTKSI